MKRFGSPLLSIAAPLLILLAILGLFHREGSEKVQSLPAFFVGGGLIIASGIRRYRKRKKFLLEIRNRNKQEN
tara:strand:- start:172 stop:390 length:219 start_codon:yes stop_codon:yes gene_type:complete